MTVTQLPLTGRAINEAGQVAGTGPGGHAILWTTSDGAIDLGTLGGAIASAEGINDAGQVVGWSQVATGLTSHAFLWSSGEGMRDLFDIAGMTAANDINNRGQVVGSGPAPDGKMHALLWTPGIGTQDLGTLGGLFTASIAYAINEAGEVVGESFMPNDPSGLHRAMLWRPGQRIRDLGTLGGQGAVARDINESSHVVGEALTQFGPHRAFLWTEAHGMQDLGSVGNFNSSAFAINDAGVVVGETDSELGPSHAGLWTAADGMEDLGVIGMSVAFDINSHLQVVGPNRLVQVELSPNNRAPVANAGGPYTGFEGSVVTFAFSATDADGDALTYAWNFGDGTGGSGPVPPATHVYADNGIYSVSLSASDTKGATDTKTTTATITNDPTGPATRGSGFIGVGSKSKGHFTFSVSFTGRSLVPDGKAKFWIPGGSVDFASSVVRMLIVSGNRVQFWGTGVLNGADASFRITAVDGDRAGSNGPKDAFRIELWQRGTLVFDTQSGAAQDAPVTTPLAGGNIQIHP